MGYLMRTNNSLYVKAYLQQELRNQSMALSLEKVVGVLSAYGRITIATGLIERLKLCNPKLYHLLYINNLEMFFFLFDKYLPSAIYQGDYAFATEEDAVRFFKEMIK